MTQVNIDVNLVPSARPLFNKHKRYKYWFGGRGRGASESVAKYLIQRALFSRIKVWCAKETQASIVDSVYSILEKNIRQQGVTDFFKFTENEIICRITQSKFIFKGLKTSGDEVVSAQKLKAYDDIDIVWVEEAQMVSKASLDALDPTIRNEYSELIFTFNPVTENDHIWVWGCQKVHQEVDLYKTKYHETKNALFIYSTFKDNPFFPAALEISRQKCLQETPEDYDHVWLGFPSKTGDYKSFFEPGLVAQACRRDVLIEQYEFAPKIMGFDPSEGGDTAEVCKRQGLKVWPFWTYRIKDPLEQANRFAIHLREEDPDASFCDAGYGAAVLAICNGQLDFNITGIHFGGASTLPVCALKREEMYYNLREYLRSGGSLPDDPILRQELNAMEINVRKSDEGIIKLVGKDIIRKKIGRSPGRADALALTFAMPVKKKDIEDFFKVNNSSQKARKSFNNYDFLKIGRR